MSELATAAAVLMAIFAFAVNAQWDENGCENSMRFDLRENMEGIDTKF